MVGKKRAGDIPIRLVWVWGVKFGIYRTISQTLKEPEQHAYADYVLLDSKGLPLAIIEAKNTLKDSILGQRQAEDIKEQTGKDTFIFLTNGYEIWFWNKPFENPRMVSGFHDRNSLERIRFQNISKTSKTYQSREKSSTDHTKLKL